MAPGEVQTRYWRIPSALIVTTVALADALNLRFEPSEERQ